MVLSLPFGAARRGCRSKVKGQMSSGASWLIGHEFIAPLADRSRTSNIQIRASCFLNCVKWEVRGS